MKLKEFLYVRCECGNVHKLQIEVEQNEKGLILKSFNFVNFDDGDKKILDKMREEMKESFNKIKKFRKMYDEPDSELIN